MDELEVGRAIGRLMAENDQLAAEVARLREAASAYLAETEGRAVTFREGMTRAELARLVGGAEVGS